MSLIGSLFSKGAVTQEAATTERAVVSQDRSAAFDGGDATERAVAFTPLQAADARFERHVQFDREAGG